MRSIKCFLLIATSALLLVVSSQAFAARMISLNFSENTSNQPFTGGQLIGPLATDSANWNTTDTLDSGGTNTNLAAGTKSNLKDNSGANAGVSVTWTCNGVYWNEDGTGDDEHKLAVGYLDDWDPIQITFSNIPYAHYRVYGLMNSDWDAPEDAIPVPKLTDINVNGIWVIGGTAAQNDVFFNGSITNNFETNRTFWTQIEPGSTVIGNYWTSITSGSTLTLSIPEYTGSEDHRGTISAIIIEEVDNFLPVNPVPVKGATLVPLTQVLSWEQFPEAAGKNVTYKVYMGTDPNSGAQPLVRTTTADPADFKYDPTPDMPYLTKYYWRVDALEPNSLGGTPVIHSSSLWSFTTQPADAQILTNPVSQTVAAGVNAQLAITSLNATKYQWYKDGVALTANAALYTGQNTGTLTVLDVQVDDEGFYTCQVDNTLNKPATSTAAQLLTRRMVGWWKLDGNLVDSIATLYPAAVVHNGTSVDPNYAAVGKDGSAADMPGDVNSLITFPESASFFNLFLRGYTVSAWVKMPDSSSWGAYVTNQDASPNRGFILTANGGNAIHTLRQSFGDLYSNVNVDNNEWHLVTGIYDATVKQGKVYVDGVLRATSTVQPGTPAASTANLLFGAERVAGDVAYIGQLDDVRIYSYPLDGYGVAHLYTDFNPGAEICVVNPVYDIAGPKGVGAEFRDCIVDIYDLAPMVAAWLECNTVSSCIPMSMPN